MSCFVLNIQKQAIITCTVRTGQQYFLGCPALWHSTVDSSFDVEQSKLLQLWSAHSEYFLRVLCWCSPSPFSRPFLFAGTNRQLIAVTPPELSDALIMPSISPSPSLTAMVFSRTGERGPASAGLNLSLTAIVLSTAPLSFYFHAESSAQSGGGCWGFCCSFQGRGRGGEALVPSCPLPGGGGPGRKELRAAAARGSVWSHRTLIGCKKVKLKPR